VRLRRLQRGQLPFQRRDALGRARVPGLLLDGFFQLLDFRQQRLEEVQVVRAARAGEGLVGDFRDAIRTAHPRPPSRGRYLTVSLNSAVPRRPSLSRTVTRIGCSPAGAATAGISMPVGLMPALTRSVRSMPLPFRYSTLTLAMSIFDSPRGSKPTLSANAPETVSGEASFTPGPRVIARLAGLAAAAGCFASSAVMSCTVWPKAAGEPSRNTRKIRRIFISSPLKAALVCQIPATASHHRGVRRTGISPNGNIHVPGAAREGEERARGRVQPRGMADPRQAFQVLFVESAQQVMQCFVPFARGGAFEVRAADAVRVAPRQRQRPGRDAVGEGALAEVSQRDHRAANEVVARGRKAGPQADQAVVRVSGAGNPIEEGLRWSLYGFRNFDAGDFFHCRRSGRFPKPASLNMEGNRISYRKGFKIFHNRVQRPHAETRSAEAGDSRRRFDVAAALEACEHRRRARAQGGERGAARAANLQRHACRPCRRWHRPPGRGAR